MVHVVVGLPFPGFFPFLGVFSFSPPLFFPFYGEGEGGACGDVQLPSPVKFSCHFYSIIIIIKIDGFVMVDVLFFFCFF